MAQIKTYTVDPAKRRIITVENMEELGITDELIKGILDEKKPILTYIMGIKTKRPKIKR
ncbi:MAG: hypothetical protein ABI554_14725 [Flavobacterium sp.]